MTEHELTLEQFIRSKWFIGTARAASIIGAAVISVGGAVAGWAVFDTRDQARITREQAERAITAVGEVRTKQNERAIVGDALAADVSDLKAEVGKLSDKADVSNEALAEIRGVVMQIAREKTASAFVPIK